MVDIKLLHIRFNKIDGFITVCDGNRYLILYGSDKYKYNSICNRIRYFIILKSGIICKISHNYAKIKVGSYDSLPLEKNNDFW